MKSLETAIADTNTGIHLTEHELVEIPNEITATHQKRRNSQPAQIHIDAGFIMQK